MLDGAEGVVERNGIDGVLPDQLLAAATGLLEEPLELASRLLEVVLPLRDDLLLRRIHRVLALALTPLV